MATYVVDQNRLRKPELQILITNEPDAILVIPDVAFVEMSKNEIHWKDTIRNSLVPLRPAVERTVLSLSIGEAMTIELASGRVIDKESLLPADFANFFRNLVAELDETRTGPSLSLVEAKFKNARAILASQELDAESRKIEIESMVETWRSGLQPEFLNALRSGIYGPDFRLAFIQGYVQNLLFPNMMKELGLTELEASAFKAAQPMVLRYMYLLVRHSLDWAISGGLPNMKPAKELNHLLDMEYAAIASYYDGLISEDEGAMAAYNDLKQILNTAENDALEIFSSTFVKISHTHND